jgi:hypothetical protein
MSALMINDIVKQWTGHASLEAIETDTLEKFALDHPYAPTIQFLLAKKFTFHSGSTKTKSAFSIN